jgi:hypothetical protein
MHHIPDAISHLHGSHDAGRGEIYAAKKLRREDGCVTV